MKDLFKKLLWSVVFAVVIYAALGFYSDVRSLGKTLASYPWHLFIAAIGLSMANYLFRFAKWQIYLKRLNISIPLLLSIECFVAGFSMAVTPGKLGEMLKSYLLYHAERIPPARTAPIVVADRLTDLIALLVIMSVGTAAFPFGLPLLLSGVLVVALIIAAVLIMPFGLWLISFSRKLPLLRRISPSLAEAYLSLREICDPKTMALTSFMAMISWSFEAVGFYIILLGFPGLEPSLFISFFIYSASTIAGALLMTPGGIGVMEGGMLGMLLSIGPSGMTRPLAAAATILIRLATLWFGVVLGLIELPIFFRRKETLDLPSS